MKAKAFCPGHITGFFEVVRGSDLLSSGSRGAGLCISLGATSEVEILDSEKKGIEIMINGRPEGAETTRRTIERLMGEDALAVRVSTELDLPESQGFGMSAAGALSAGVSLCELLSIDAQQAFEAAHCAEIECSTGMGDVSAIGTGGIVIREIAGLPPRGRVHRIEGNPDVVLAIVGDPLKTAGAIIDPAFVARVNCEGGPRVDDLISNPTIDNLMRLSASFAMQAGLATEKVVRAMTSASQAGSVSMAMLGNSVFAVGPTDELAAVLSEHGRTYTCQVDTDGARIL